MTDNLAAFLLARWAEREEVANDDLGNPDALHSRRRRAREILADLNAKRRIVALFQNENHDDHQALYGGCGDDCQWKALEYVLRLLTLPHTAHPDYRQEWAP
jgi:hypothetical protein